jgi:hypothetical protein
MNKEEFVEAIHQYVSESAIEATIRQLERPSGRKPDHHLVELSGWYATLDNANKERLKDVLTEAARAAIFGFCCVLDGVRLLEDGATAGKFELCYIKGEDRALINDPEQEELHNLFNWYSRDRYREKQ